VAGPLGRKQRRSAPLDAEVAARLEANKTVDLDTADLDELAQQGVVITKTAQGLVRRAPDDAAEPSIVVAPDPPPPVDQGQTIAELPQQRLGAAAGERDIRTMHVARVNATPAITSRTRGLWIVVLVYLVSAGALILSIYARVTS
jgi:hypothetical protein